MSRNVSDAKKKNVAGKQYFKCANEPGKKLRGLDGYKCPLWQIPGRNQGCFDESGYEIDHIVEYCVSKDDSVKNLHALCKMCHLVKTKRFAMSDRSESSEKTDDSEEDEMPVKKTFKNKKSIKKNTSTTGPIKKILIKKISSGIIISGFDCGCGRESECDCELDDDDSIISNKKYFREVYKKYCNNNREYQRIYKKITKFLEGKNIPYFNKFINAWIRDLDEFEQIISMNFSQKMVLLNSDYFKKEFTTDEHLAAEAATRDVICDIMCIYDNKLCRELKKKLNNHERPLNDEFLELHFDDTDVYADV